MAGTYAGGYHGTDHEFFGSSTGSVAASHDRLRERAARNIAAASNGGRNLVVSADGRRVLSSPARKSSEKAAARRAAKPEKFRGSGPGHGRVGSARTSGPGAPGVGSAPTSGPGLGVVTQGGFSEVGPSFGAGPGVGVVGALPSGVAGVGTVGWAGAFGVGTGAPADVTEVYIGGNKLPRDPLTSDAQEIEDAYGEGDFLSPTWFLNWGAFATNMAYGVAQWSKTNLPAAQEQFLETFPSLRRKSGW